MLLPVKVGPLLAVVLSPAGGQANGAGPIGTWQPGWPYHRQPERIIIIDIGVPLMRNRFAGKIAIRAMAWSYSGYQYRVCLEPVSARPAW